MCLKFIKLKFYFLNEIWGLIAQVVKLREFLKELGLETKGLKAVLVERLNAAIEDAKASTKTEEKVGDAYSNKVEGNARSLSIWGIYNFFFVQLIWAILKFS